MSTTRLISVALALAVAGGCKSEDLLAGLPDAAPPPDAAAPACEPVVFLNRHPTPFFPGEDDAVANTSRMISGPLSTTGAGLSDAEWQAVVGCVDELLAPFGVRVTDVDPGTVDHIEIAFSEDPMDIGISQGTSGIAPVACPPTLRRGVAFEFSGYYSSGSSRFICEDVADLVGHIAGLDHAYQCGDLLSWLTGCGDEAFLDEDVPCGEFEARECNCTELVTNRSQRCSLRPRI